MPTMTIKEALALGLEHHQAGRLAEAEAVYRQILAQNPEHADSLHLLGVIAGNRGRVDEAAEWIQRAIVAAPRVGVYYRNLAWFFQRTGQSARALEWLGRGVQAAGDSAELWHDFGNALLERGDAAGAEAALGHALRLAPGHAPSYWAMGLLYRGRGDYARALAYLEKGVAIDPNAPEGRGNLGGVLELLGRYEEALAQYRLALPQAPNHFMLHYNIGVSLAELWRYAEAEIAYRQAIALKPDYAPAHNNLGNTLRFMGRFEEAMVAYQRTIALSPDLPEVYTNLAAIHQSRGEHAQGLACDRKALALRPQHAQAHGNLCYTMLFQPEFDTAALAAELRAWNQRQGEPRRGLRRPHTNSAQPERRLRIGYVSPDLREHVIGRNLMPLFRARDRAAFEVFCYSNLAVKDEMTHKFMAHGDHWRDIWAVPDEAVVEQIKADGIDILVDLTLHLAGSRIVVFTYKPAPVQVTFAGYPGSTGLETMDYRITDGHLEPEESQGAYIEKSVRLASFWCFDPLELDVAPGPLPALQKGFVTFGCLNNFAKVNDGVLELWSQVLAAAPASRLMLLTEAGTHRDRTRAFFEQRGISGTRIEFVSKRQREEYLTWYQQIDMGLDTVPYNGHSTSLDSLWMGVPVVTLVGRTEVGRAGLSQLTNLGMPELITRTPEEFVHVARALAADLPGLAAYRAQLRGRMAHSVLMDAAAFARGIEGAYRTMWRAWCAGARR